MHAILDFLGAPRQSQANKPLNFFGRLTCGWLWTDDPRYAEIDEELKRKGQ